MTSGIAGTAGQRVIVVEHDDRTREPRPGGDRHPGTVLAVEGIYAQVCYDDPAANGGRPDAFYAGSGWRAWDGEFRWRLQRQVRAC
jgi:hypothetical protein